MLGNLIRRDKDTPPLPEPDEPLTVAEKLAAIRLSIAAANEEMQHLHGEQDRCNRLSAEYLQLHQVVADARSVLETLFAKRVAGESVSDAEFASAEKAVADALHGAQNADVAAAGARSAATRLDRQILMLESELRTLHAQAVALLLEVCHERAAASYAEFQKAITEFTARYCTHHGTLTAIAEICRQHGFAPVEPFADMHARYLTIHGAGNVHGPSGSHEFDLHKQISAIAEGTFADLSNFLS